MMNKILEKFKKYFAIFMFYAIMLKTRKIVKY